MLCTYYGPLQCFSTYFRKLKEIGVLRHIFPDYVISCDYEYIDNYSSGRLWQYHRDEPCLHVNDAIDDFLAAKNNSASYNVKTKKVGRAGNDGTKIVKIMIALKYLSNFWRIFEMPLINCEINHILTLSANSFIKNDPVNNQVPTFEITDTKLYVPVVTLSTQDNQKLLQQLKSGFKRTTN